MPPVGFEPTISAGEPPQTYALDRATIGTDIYMCVCVCVYIYIYMYTVYRYTRHNDVSVNDGLQNDGGPISL